MYDDIRISFQHLFELLNVVMDQKTTKPELPKIKNQKKGKSKKNTYEKEDEPDLNEKNCKFLKIYNFYKVK